MSDILKMLEMFEVNHEFAPAAQRDLDEIINALRATPAPPAREQDFDIPPFLRRNPEDAPAGKRLCECGKSYVAAPVAPVEASHPDCNYAAFRGTVCNKCGEVHTGEQFTPAPVAQKVPDEWIKAAQSIVRSPYIKQHHPKRHSTFVRLLAAAQAQEEGK